MWKAHYKKLAQHQGITEEIIEKPIANLLPIDLSIN